jgi:NADH dehydrogenase
MAHIKKVVVVGGGFGGVAVAKQLSGVKNVEVLLLDKRNHHLFQPLLYQVATAALSPSDIAYPLRSIFSKSPNVRVVMGDVVDIDRSNKTIILEDGGKFDYDYLVIAVGARHSYYGNPEWEENATGLKTLNDALRIREKILVSLEKAERAETPEEISKYLTFVVVGGGPTGVEMAGAIAEITKKTMVEDFRKIDPKDTRVILIEGGPRLLMQYPPDLSLKAKRDLEDMGVTVLTEKIVTDVKSDRLFFGKDINEELVTANIVWAAGNEASTLMTKLNVELTRTKHVKVRPDFSLPDDDAVFCIGDCAFLADAKGVVVPGIAPAAIQAGKYVSKLIKSRIKTGENTHAPFIYFDKGSMATIGRAKAIAVVGPIKLSGIIAWLAWSLIHVLYLIDFRSRFAVMFSWMWSFFTHHRAGRLIIYVRRRSLDKK